MNYIARYKPITDEFTTYHVRLKDDARFLVEPKLIRLAEIDDYVYISVDQMAELIIPEVITTYEKITNSPEIIELIKTHSKIIKQIDAQVVSKIRERYSSDQEHAFARLVASSTIGIYELTDADRNAITEYHSYVESCRSWGRHQKSELGVN